MNKIIVQINVNGLIKGKKKGDRVVVEVDNNGTPFDLFWFKRLRDSKIDNCVSIVTEEKTKKSGGK